MISRFLHCFCVLLACLLAWSDVLAADGSAGAEDMVVVVSRNSSVQSLSKLQVDDIFLGKALVFPGGQRAVPVDQAEGSETRGRFYNEVLGRTSAQIRAHWSRLVFTGRGRPPRSVASGDELLQLMANDPQVIGYVERRKVNGTVKVVLE